MTKLNYFQLISGQPIIVKGIGEFRSPTIRDISEIGEETYNKYLRAICNLKSTNEAEAIYAIMNTEEFEDALRFFVKFDFDNIDFKSDTLYEDTIENSCDLILQLNYMNHNTESKPKFKNEAAAILWDRMQKAIVENPKNKGDAISLGTVISALVTAHNSYNLTNVWELTVYQLYDQFFRLHALMSYDINAMRFSAWGGEDFDPTSWYKQKQEKGA